jgi:hypothetical protein
MLTTAKPNDVSDIFEKGAGWTFISTEKLKREGIYPNQLAYHVERQIVALILKKGNGDDCAINKNGLNYLSEVEKAGKLKNGNPVSSAVGVVGKPDPDAPDIGALKIATSFTVEEMRERVRDRTLMDGKAGSSYWWIPIGDNDDDEMF